MIRPKSTDVWFNAPGVVAAYQPVAAPGPLLARYNVGNDERMAGRYTAQPGMLPTWNGAAGWRFDGATQYLTTSVPVVSNAYTGIVRWSGFDTLATGYRSLFGYYDADVDTFMINAKRSDGRMGWYNAGVLSPSLSPVAAGVAAVAGNAGYLDGASVGTMTQGANSQTNVYLGATYYSGGAANHCGCNMQAVMIGGVTLSPAHVRQYSRQMAYCHVNPDWSAWGRRRRYYYAPSAAALAAWRGVGRNSSPVGGSIGVNP